MWSHTKRLDLSSWLIHFVHEHKPEDTFRHWAIEQMGPEDVIEDVENCQCPDYFNNEGYPIVLYDEMIDDDWELSSNASSFQILQRVIHDGFLKSSWSFRRGNPTVYGPYSVVCFTEMPLYALIDYANKRGGFSGYVGGYGIALKKKELFAAGARSAIYGLSGKKYEAIDPNDNLSKAGFRALASECGIGRDEQYRYVHTDLDREPPIDWTFEREWRLAIKDERWGGIPGIPFFLSKAEYNTPVSEVVIIVSTNEEKKLVLDQLTNMFLSKSTNLGYNYQLELIRTAKVISVEQLKGLSNYDTIQLDGIDPAVETGMSLLPISDETLRRVENILTETHDICDIAMDKFTKQNPGVHTYSYPISHIKICTDVNSEVTQALVLLGKASTFSEGRYYVDTPYTFTGNEEIGKLIMQNAADYLTEKLGQHFYVFVIPD